MIQSKYLTTQLDWDERIRIMEGNLNGCYYDYLYFNIVLNMIDSRDNADYDKEKLFIHMLSAYKHGAFETVRKSIDELKGMI